MQYICVYVFTLYENWRFHGNGDYLDCGFLMGCDTTWTCRWFYSQGWHSTYIIHNPEHNNLSYLRFVTAVRVRPGSSPPLHPSFPVTYAVYYFPAFLSSPPLPCCDLSWFAADFLRGHLPFCRSTGHTPLSDQNCGWDVYTFRFRNLVFGFIPSTLCSIVFPFLGFSRSEGQLCTLAVWYDIWVCVCVIDTHGE
jgi:hypothetical protein